jgi:predicted peptidase
MFNSSKNDQLDKQNENAATHRDENLAHDDVSNLHLWLLEVDHQLKPNLYNGTAM